MKKDFFFPSILLSAAASKLACFLHHTSIHCYLLTSCTTEIKRGRKIEKRTNKIYVSNSCFSLCVDGRIAGGSYDQVEQPNSCLWLAVIDLCGERRELEERYGEGNQFLSSSSCSTPSNCSKGKVRCIDRPHTMKKGRETSIE